MRSALLIQGFLQDLACHMSEVISVNVHMNVHSSSFFGRVYEHIMHANDVTKHVIVCIIRSV
jgi:hypothetical protein